jgi:hypothetical protein
LKIDQLAHRIHINTVHYKFDSKKLANMSLSKRGSANVDAIMPRIGAAVAERVMQNNQNIDLGTSENWLIRDELITIYKDAVEKKLTETVSIDPQLYIPLPIRTAICIVDNTCASSICPTPRGLQAIKSSSTL